MKCAICGEKIKITFLNKPVGTYIRKGGKLRTVCNNCQHKYSMEEIKQKI